jgi:3-deoxy-D-manno-octulosonic-acid transferase
VSPALALYRWATRLIEPLAPRLLDRRAALGKEDPARVDERLGQPGVERPEGDVVWLHGVSVGETLSLLPVVERFRRSRPDLTVLVTSGTVTSAELMAKRLPPGVIHQYAPVDGPCAVAAFLDYWRPVLGVLVESELWPNLLIEAQKRGVALALVSARVTEKSADGWKRAPGMARRLLSNFDLILPQDDASADRLAAMGARVDGQVNLKLAGDPLPHDGAAFSRLSEGIGDTPVIVAASTHEAEELALTRALDVLPTKGLLILVPRHPDRGPAVADALSQAGYRVGLRSRGDVLDESSTVYVADTLGELGLFLRLADVVVMGGSFAPALGLDPVGGHNPLEPARLGKATISGPDASNWQSVAGLLRDAGGLAVVQTPSELPAVVAPLLKDPARAAAMGERARRAAADAGAGLDRLWTDLQPLLPPAPPPLRGARR